MEKCIQGKIAYLGVVFLAGCKKSWDVPIRDLLGNKFSNPMYKATMSAKKFEKIWRFLRFEKNDETREFRLQIDHMAAFRYVWDLFISNCKKWYNPCESVTIDEQLIPFRERYKFIEYVPSQRRKYSITIFWLCDSTTYYGFNESIYTGRQPGKEVKRNIGVTLYFNYALHYITLHTNSNVKAENFFTSVPLTELLLNKNLTLVVILRQNKTDIRPILKTARNREQYSTDFGFKRDITMVSYVLKKEKAVIRLSTMHHDKAIDEKSKRKIVVIQYYNDTN